MRSRGESFPTIFKQKSASIQPRASIAQFARSPCTDPPGDLRINTYLERSPRSQGRMIVVFGYTTWSAQIRHVYATTSLFKIRDLARARKEATNLLNSACCDHR